LADHPITVFDLTGIIAIRGFGLDFDVAATGGDLQRKNERLAAALQRVDSNTGKACFVRNSSARR